LELLKLFFPSWEFFDEHSKPVKLFYKYGITEHSLQEMEWHTAFELKPISFSNIFLNEEVNLLLAYNSAIENLIKDINDLNDVSNLHQLSSYIIVKAITLKQIQKNDNTFFYYKFKLATTDNHKIEDVLISPNYETHAYNKLV
jgi:hypothetical protein